MRQSRRFPRIYWRVILSNRFCGRISDCADNGNGLTVICSSHEFWVIGGTIYLFKSSTNGCLPFDETGVPRL